MENKIQDFMDWMAGGWKEELGDKNVFEAMGLEDDTECACGNSANHNNADEDSCLEGGVIRGNQ